MVLLHRIQLAFIGRTVRLLAIDLLPERYDPLLGVLDLPVDAFRLSGSLAVLLPFLAKNAEGLRIKLGGVVHELLKILQIGELLNQFLERSLIVQHIELRLSLEHTETLHEGIVAPIDELLAGDVDALRSPHLPTGVVEVGHGEVLGPRTSPGEAERLFNGLLAPVFEVHGDGHHIGFADRQLLAPHRRYEVQSRPSRRGVDEPLHRIEHRGLAVTVVSDEQRQAVRELETVILMITEEIAYRYTLDKHIRYCS